MINVKEKKTERTEKIGKGQTAPKRKKTATVERIAQAIGSKRFLAIVLCCCAWAVFHAVNMYAVYSDLLKRVRDALPIYSGEEMQRFAELTSDLIYTFRVTAGIYCILECILPIAAAAAFAAVHCDARRGQLAEGSGIPLLRMTLAVRVVIGIAAAVTLCLLVVCAAELEQDIIVFRKTVLNIIATPPPVFTPMRIAAIIITSGGINAALCTLECFLFRMFGNVRSQRKYGCRGRNICCSVSGLLRRRARLFCLRRLWQWGSGIRPFTKAESSMRSIRRHLPPRRVRFSPV